MHKILQLQHHSHTGKRLAHHHTSWRALFLILLVFGGVLVSVTQHAVADSIVIRGKIPAPPITQAAVITFPLNGTVVQNPNVTIIGTCQYSAPPLSHIVEIYSTATLLGTTLCAGDGTFTLVGELISGENQLIARTVNITDDYGPDSNPVRVMYPFPGRPAAPASSGKPAAPKYPDSSPVVIVQPSAMQLISKTSYIVYGPNKPAEWIGSIIGGRGPFVYLIDWGDGTNDQRTVAERDDQTFSHAYQTFKAYTITVTITDANKSSITRTFVAVTPYAGGGTGSTITGPWGGNQSIVWGVYGGYLLLIALVGMAWYDARYGLIRKLAPAYAGGRSPKSKQFRVAAARKKRKKRE